MRRHQFKKLVNITDAQRERLFDRMGTKARAESANVCTSGKNARHATRYEYRRSDVPIAVTHPGGNVVTLLVVGRNISSGGIAFVHGGYMHTGTRCTVVLQQIGGEMLGVEGTVVNSRHLNGSLHEVSVRFDRRIEIAQFMSAAEQMRSAIVEQEPKPEMWCHALVLEPSNREASALQRHFQGTGVRPTIVPTPGAAIDAVKKRRFAFLLVDFDLGNDNSLHVLKDLRNTGHAGPILLLLSDQSQDQSEAALAAGATHILSKPYKATALYGVLDEISETFSSQPSASEQASARAGQLSVDLQRAIEEQAIDRVSALCAEVMAVAGQATTNPEFEARAGEALKQIASAATVQEVADEVGIFASLCDSVSR